jgi:tRNA(Ile)-lysidine synthase
MSKAITFNESSLEAACLRLGMDKEEHSFLLALSGGCDSSSLLRMIVTLGFKVEAAHMNYGLRGEESDADAEFCHKLCKQLGVKLHYLKQSIEPGISVQTTARKQRLEWFKVLKNECGFHRVLMAHHSDDVLETIIINLVRGTGPRGLRGIPAKTSLVMRPFLSFSRAEIESYAREKNWKWREDSSNASGTYRRNQLRRQVLPLLKSWNPRWKESLLTTTERLELAIELYESGLNRLRSELIHEDMQVDGFRLSLMELYGKGVSGLMLWEILKPYGFERSAVKKYWNGGAVTPGAMLESGSYALRREGAFLVAMQRTSEYSWEGNLPEVMQLEKGFGGEGSFCTWAYYSGLPDWGKLKNNFWELYIPCCEEYNFRLALLWGELKPGMRLRLFGMSGSKKVSDLLQATEMPLKLRERLPGLYFEEKLIWVPGLRGAEIFRFKGDEGGYWVVKIKKPC